MQSPSNLWYHCRLVESSAPVRLVCFPPAGGGTVQFFAWPQDLGHNVEVHVAQLPGRERRRQEPPLLQAEPLLEQLFAAILPLADRPLALYGHSMGALMAFEIARRLEATGMAQPMHVLVAARRAPHVAWPRVPLETLSDEEFARELQVRWGAMPRAITENPELLGYFLPLIRADITLLESYRFPVSAPLRCPITSYGGRRDPSTSIGDLEAWKERTTGGFRLRIFEGDHFFPQEQRGLLLEDIASTLGLRQVIHA